jgi:hypothetical protein
MLYREIIPVCSQINKKHINTLCVQNVDMMNVKLMIHIVTTGLKSTLLLVATASADRLRMKESKSCSSVHCTGCLLLTENCCSTTESSLMLLFRLK